MCPVAAPGRKWPGYQNRKVREERKRLVCNQSPITVDQQENRCEMSFFWLGFSVSKPVSMHASKWINKPLAIWTYTHEYIFFQCFFLKSTQLPDLCPCTGLVTPSLILLMIVTGQKGDWAPGRDKAPVWRLIPPTHLRSQGQGGCGEAVGWNVGGWPGSTSALVAQLWSKTQMGHRPWQGVYIGLRPAVSNPRSSGLHSVLCTGWKGAPIHLPACKNICIYSTVYVPIYMYMAI